MGDPAEGNDRTPDRAHSYETGIALVKGFGPKIRTFGRIWSERVRVLPSWWRLFSSRPLGASKRHAREQEPRSIVQV